MGTAIPPRSATPDQDSQGLDERSVKALAVLAADAVWFRAETGRRVKEDIMRRVSTTSASSEEMSSLSSEITGKAPSSSGSLHASSEAHTSTLLVPSQLLSLIAFLTRAFYFPLLVLPSCLISRVAAQRLFVWCALSTHNTGAALAALQRPTPWRSVARWSPATLYHRSSSL